MLAKLLDDLSRGTNRNEGWVDALESGIDSRAAVSTFQAKTVYSSPGIDLFISKEFVMIHNSRFLRTETTCSTCFSLPSHEKYWLPLLSRVFSPPRPLRAPPLEGGSLTSTLTHSGKSIEPASPSFERSTCARGKEGRKERRGEDNRGSSGECSESPPSNFTSLHFTLFSPDFEQSSYCDLLRSSSSLRHGVPLSLMICQG